MILSDIFPLLPEFWLVLSVLFILILGMFSSDRFKAVPAMVGVLGALVLPMSMGGGNSKPIAFVMDSFGYLCGAVLLTIAGLIIMMSEDFLERIKANKAEFFLLILTLCLGGRICLGANNMLSAYLGLELIGMSSYILVPFRRGDIFAVEAGVKHFIMGAVGSAMLLYGISIFYGISGTIDFEETKLYMKLFAEQNEVKLALAFLFGGMFIKLGAVPFHMDS
jgi:NADH-quinone oxidoreductase subunit N